MGGGLPATAGRWRSRAVWALALAGVAADGVAAREGGSAEARRAERRIEAPGLPESRSPATAPRPASVESGPPGGPGTPAPPPAAAPPAPAPQPGAPGPSPPPAGAPDCASAILAAEEVGAIVRAAAAASANPALTIAVTDRLGRPLAVFRKPQAPAENDDRALGLARTAAFFSNDQAPLSSRTVRFISGIHFPPGIRDTPNGALYGIENTNRGCDLGVAFNPGREVPAARSLAGLIGDEPCDAFSRLGCGPGVVTGKVDPLDSSPRAVDPGGVPIFRPRIPFDGSSGPGDVCAARLLGGIGVAGASPAERELAAFLGALGEGATAPVPQFPLPPPRNVFIDGVRLPFVETVARPPGIQPGLPLGSFVLEPRPGREAPDGYLAGPRGGQALSFEEVELIVRQAVFAALRTRAVIRLPRGSRSRMAIAVSDVDGELLAVYRMPDSTVFSIDVAAAKARNVVYFSSSPLAARDLPGVPAGTAVTNRTIGFGAQPLFPPGIDGSGPGPFFDLFLSDLANPCSQGSEPPGRHQSGVVFFPGSVPLYRGGTLVGGLGISGDGVEQDDYVAFLGAAGFLPAEAIQANRVFIRGVRLPFLRFPRNPEG